MFALGHTYEFTFFAGSSEGTVRKRATVIDLALPLVKVRDRNGETIINTSSAAFVEAKLVVEEVRCSSPLPARSRPR